MKLSVAVAIGMLPLTMNSNVAINSDQPEKKPKNDPKAAEVQRYEAPALTSRVPRAWYAFAMPSMGIANTTRAAGAKGPATPMRRAVPMATEEPGALPAIPIIIDS